MAQIVPVGMDFFGSFRSPDIETPASKPVTAGKKMPKSTMNGTACGIAAAGSADGAKLWLPKKIDSSDRTIAARMKN